ncbi:MAG: transcriptional regulator GcvA [Burkholderiales bacterium]|nr:transcriptional regulator GcvA [Burkholderiales bacterium]
MPQRLPPLNALRAFEAAARHESFARAAAELFVTPAAVSHQVKALEAYLELKLFLRQNNTLTLTEAGRAYLPGVHEAFREIERATAGLQSRRFEQLLNLSAPPTFAARWLRPRLARFGALYPDLEVRLAAAKARVDFAREDFDAAIRYGRGDWPGLVAERFLGDEMFPVCTPALLARTTALRSPDDLRFHTLLHDGASAHDETAPDWSAWIRRVGAVGVDARKGPVFTPGHLVIDAALDGEGVALVKASWVEALLADGRLVRPLDDSVPSECSYWLVRPTDRPVPRRLALFRAWLFAQTGVSGLEVLPTTPDCVVG